MKTTIFIALTYLIGSLSSAVILCKLNHLPDPRLSGSGNPGATNVLRLGNRKIAVLTLLGDALKGFIMVALAKWSGITGFALGMVAFASVVGHMFPVFFGFRGGKGIATFIGCLFGLSPLLGLIAVTVWLVVAKLSRYSSLAGLTMALSTSVLAPFFHTGYSFGIGLLAILIIWQHRENIQRLRAGTESKIKRTYDKP